MRKIKTFRGVIAAIAKRKDVKWQLDHGCVRTVGEWHCPLSAIVPGVPPCDARLASKKLGLPQLERMKVVNAADNHESVEWPAFDALWVACRLDREEAVAQ